MRKATTDPTRRHALTLLATAALTPAGVRAQPVTQVNAPAELLGELPAPKLQGAGRLRFLGLHVYDIRLWGADTARVGDNWALAPLALEIEYARALVGRQIAERSIEEMRRSGPIAAESAERWLDAMVRLFPDVRPGDRITGIQRPGNAARFFFNGSFRGEVPDAEFARRFFGIWLSAATSEPRLRASLLGRS